MNRRSMGSTQVRSWRGAGSAAALVSLVVGCGGESDLAGARAVTKDDAEEVAEAAEALTSSQGCVQIWRQGASGAVEDTQIVDKAPPKNYGTSGTMSVGWFGVPFVERQLLLQFDLSSIPPGPQTNITAANVFLARGPLAPTGPGTIDVHRITAPWSETSVTWQSFAGAYDPTVQASFGNGGDYFAFGLQPLVQSWVQGSSPNYGILLQETDTNGSNFYSSEGLSVFSRPQLGVCFTITCAPSFADCNTNAFDGCETDTTTTVAHCGGCGQACSPPHATPACVAGACQIGACNAGFADCDSSGANGCETPLDTITDCGACGVSCTIPGGTGTCATGTCALSACNAGHFDCDGDPSNGCEALPCAVGQRCSTGADCAAGVCQAGICAAPACGDGVKNGSETGVDCGGPSCPSCPAGQGCTIPGECQSGVCQAGVCQAPTCSDGVKNGTEAGVDCGGSCPTSCFTTLTPRPMSQITGGYYFTVVAKGVGTVVTSGDNSSGQLGIGNPVPQVSSQSYTGLGSGFRVSAGFAHTFALSSNGSLWVWGQNQFGQLGLGAGGPFNATIPVQNPFLSNVVHAAAGWTHSLVALANGTVFAFGNNSSGQLGNNGTNPVSTPGQVAGVGNIVAVAAGNYHSLALRSDGIVLAWGGNDDGQLGDGTTITRKNQTQVNGLSDVVAIAAGDRHSLAVRFDGTVWAWGRNAHGELGDGTTTDRSLPVQVVGLSGVTAIAAGQFHSLALTSSHTVWAWGANGDGQLGDGTNAPHFTPVQTAVPPGFGVVTAIGCGGLHSVAIANGGTFAWGYNGLGQFGNGTFSNGSNVPSLTGF